MTTTDLASRYHAYREQNPKARIRNAARDLGVSELALLTLGNGSQLVRLNNDPGPVFHDLASLGEVMALTRNDACVIETHGVYDNVEIGRHASMVNSEGVDLRMFLGRWAYAYAVATPWERGQDGFRHSIQFFDAAGHAVHKTFLTRRSTLDALPGFIDRHRAPEDAPPELAPVEPAKVEAGTLEHPEQFLDDWQAMEDPHDFFHLLHRYGIGRTTALTAAEGRFTTRLDRFSIRTALEAAAAEQFETMTFVGNPGCIQIYTGTIRTLKEYAPWYNVLDPKYNLHLDEQQIETVWAVVKPGDTGYVTSLEAYDASGHAIIQLFGRRKPGQVELPAWRQVIEDLAGKATYAEMIGV